VSRKVLHAAGLVFVLPLYLVFGALVRWLMGPDPILSDDSRFLFFGLCCALGLGCAVLADFVEARLLRHDGAGELTPGLVAMMLAETPAFFGLLYFVSFRDWLGYGLLLAATAGAFAWRMRAKNEQD